MNALWGDLESPAATGARLLVTVGSDHHRFDRLIDWLDAWLARHSADEVRAVVQYGTARPPRFGAGVAWVDHGELEQLMREASVIVAQGGPYSILESGDVGRLPIAVPRRRALNEVVDDHQFAFCALMAQLGRAVVATTERELHDALDRALAHPESFTVSPRDSAVAETVERFAGLVTRLTPRRRRAVLSAVARRQTRSGHS
jgi:UDP-N-acetylglucosamine transferase subunit ALG13